VQQWLLDRRVLTQTFYREIREPTQTATVPPILLVRIDNESIKQLMREMNTSQINPIHQGYLGNLLRQLSTHQPQLVGVDYLLDRAQPSTEQLLLRRY
jgi:CHASE2 domain-containing sensor protein